MSRKNLGLLGWINCAEHGVQVRSDRELPPEPRRDEALVQPLLQFTHSQTLPGQGGLCQSYVRDADAASALSENLQRDDVHVHQSPSGDQGR